MLNPSLLILASLADGEKHGYAMMQDIRSFAGVDLGAGTLYGAISRLEQQGFIEALRTKDRRQPYRLTANGRKFLAAQIAELEPVVRTTARRLSTA
ncbi:MAG: helix-turn-helix transcriptional regulator [Gemmatimonadaceae bacterium]